MTPPGRPGANGYVVVGGGVAGICAAWHLADATDEPVTLLERRDRVGRETTAKSGAFVGHWGHESPTGLSLLQDGIRFYNQHLDASPDGPRYLHRGRLHVATSDEGDEALRSWFRTNLGVAAGDAPVTAEKGAPVQYLPGDSLGERLVLSGLDLDRVTGAIYSPTVGFVDEPGLLAVALANRARQAGVAIETGVTVTDVATADGRVEGVVADGDLRPAAEVVCAAGPWNRRLCATAGVELPVRHTRGPMLSLAATPPHGGPALFHEETGVYTRPNPDGTLSVGHYPGEYEVAAVLPPSVGTDPIPADRRQACLAAARQLLPGVADGAVREEWMGVRTLTPDGEPIVGRLGVEGLSVLSFNANGIQLAPAAGRIVRAQLVDDRPSPAYDAVSIARFDGYDDSRPDWEVGDA